MTSPLRPSSAHRARSRAACFLRPGFSMLELTIVMAIIGITSAVAVGRYWSSLGNYRAELAASRLAQDLQLAQTRARSTSTSQTIEFSESASAYRLPGEKPLTPADPDMRVRLKDDPFNVRIVALRTTLGTTTVQFDGYGTPNQALQVRVGSGDHTRTVEMDASGVIRVTRP